MSSSLSEEQKKRIEENRRKALALRHKKLQASPNKASVNAAKPTPYTRPNVANAKTSSVPLNANKCLDNSIGGRDHVFKPSLLSGSSSSSSVKNPCSPIKLSSSSFVDGATSSFESNSSVQQIKSSSNTAAKVSNIDLDRIEQNRQKALARRAEKLSQSPGKAERLPETKFGQTATTSSTENRKSSVLDNQAIHSINGTTVEHSKPANSIQGTKSTFGENQTHTMNSILQSNNVGQNIFTGFSGTPVKGDCFLVSRDRFTVKSGYSEPLIQLFKAMDTRLYDAVTRNWSFKLSEYNKFMKAVVNLKPAVVIEPLPPAILKIFNAQLMGGNSQKTIPMADLSKVEPSLVNSLMSFQREGVNFGIHQNGRVLIADDMGLGKTIQAICIACYYKSDWPLLVVVPSSVRFDWAQNFQRWVPSLDPQCINTVVSGKGSCTSGLINILSYDLMARKANDLKAKRFQTIIMDECHFLKNYKTARCKGALPLLQNARRVLLLSGTPALSRPLELFTQINAVCPYLFKFHDFGMRYCNGKQMPWGPDYSGSSNMEELQILLEENIMIRRLKTEVLKELPDKIRQMIMLDPSLIQASKELKSACKVMSSGNLKKMEERGALLDFFHKSGSAKMKAIKSYVDDILEGDKKFLIFAHHADVLDGIEESVRSKISDNYIRIDGKCASEQRNFLCKKFQHNVNVKVAILSITAANAGLNLSSASLVIFAELFWNPGILVQAEDRAHRIGQQDMVCVQYLVATGTSDDNIWPMIQKKLDVLGKAGLTKDNFSSAQTTRLIESRQDEITKFLEESFSEDTALDKNEEFLTPRKKALRQTSILKYVSPDKDCVATSQLQSSPQTKCPKQKRLFEFFSPGNETSSVRNGDEKNSKLIEMPGSSYNSNSAGNKGRTIKGQGRSDEGHSDNDEDDLDEFFNQCGDFLDENMDSFNDEPFIKKRKV